MTGLLGADVEALDDLARVVGTGSDTLRGVAERTSSSLGTLTWSGQDGAAFRDAWHGAMRPGLDQLAARLGELGGVLRAQAQEQRATSAGGGTGGSAGPGAAGAGAAGGPGAPAPVHGTPAANAAWWRGLTPAQQAAFAKAHPDVVGGMDGLPGHVRSDANTARIPALRGALTTERDALRADLASRWTGGLFTDADDRLAVTEQKLHALDAVDTTMARGGRQLLELDTSGEQTTAVVAVGDVDTADHVAVFTPGLTTTVQGSLEGYDAQVAQLRSEAEASAVRYGDGGSVAAVSWLGYRAPQLTDTGADFVGSDHLARAGAADLAPFLRGLDDARATPAHLTALGHSYGSLTTGLALQQGTGVDDVVFFGSPGVGTSNTSALQVPAGHAYYVKAAMDPVTAAGWFGKDPAWMPGMTGLSSAAGTAPDGSALTASSGHLTAGANGYLAPGSTSQHNMAAVVAGVPERVVTRRGELDDLLSWPVPGTYR